MKGHEPLLPRVCVKLRGVIDVITKGRIGVQPDAAEIKSVTNHYF
jgi:hypothetical protein